MKFVVEFEPNEEQMEELKMLQAAMKKTIDNEEYYTLEKVFEFVMELSSVKRINDAIENAAYYYDELYDDYPYKYGSGRTAKMLDIEKETGKYVSHAYPNPRILRN